MSTAPVPPDGENPALAAIKTLGSKLCCYAGDWRPDAECRAPHCWSEYGTPCATCPKEKR